MTNLQKLASLTACSVTIHINDHRSVYETVDYAMDRLKEDGELDDVPEEVQAKMRELNSIASVFVYPDHPVTSFVVYHYDVEQAIAEAVREMEQHRLTKPLQPRE